MLVLPPASLGRPGAATVVGGGRRAPDSVRAGFAAVPTAEVVVVHDAAPAGVAALFDAVIAAVRAGADAAVPGSRSPTP